MIDENSRTTGFGVSNLDGKTFVNIKANPTTHHLRTKMIPGQTDLGNGPAVDSDSNQPLKAMTASGEIVTLYVTPDGKLLVKYA